MAGAVWGTVVGVGVGVRGVGVGMSVGVGVGVGTSVATGVGVRAATWVVVVDPQLTTIPLTKRKLNRVALRASNLLVRVSDEEGEKAKNQKKDGEKEECEKKYKKKVV